MGADIIVLGLSSITSGACFANLGRGAGGCLQPRPQGIVELTFSLSLSLSLSLSTVWPIWFSFREIVQTPFILRDYREEE